MKFSSLKNLLALTCAGFLLPVSAANALPIVGLNRTGTLDTAIAGGIGTESNLDANLVHNVFGGTWTEVGHLDSSNTGPTVDLLTMTFTNGTWGGTDVAGTWAIDPSFWATYGSAVIGWHVGNGSGDPDEFLFQIAPNQTSGTWSYKVNSGSGGGFSNFQLFGSGKPTSVPDGGATAGLLGLTLGGVVMFRRFTQKKA